MPNFVLVSQAAEASRYSVMHIRFLLRNKQVEGQKVGGTWLVDLDGLLRYEKEMEDLGLQKYNPARNVTVTEFDTSDENE